MHNFTVKSLIIMLDHLRLSCLNCFNYFSLHWHHSYFLSLFQLFTEIHLSQTQFQFGPIPLNNPLFVVINCLRKIRAIKDNTFILLPHIS